MCFEPETFLLFCTISIMSLALPSFDKNSCKNLNDYPIWVANTSCEYNPDVLSTVPLMVERHGYKVETYTVTTTDRYILTIFRVSSNNVAKTNGTIFLQHGVGTNSDPWVSINNRSLAFNLVDCGYDVWLGSVRGTTYSTKHENLTTDNPEYWDYNLDDLAKEDIRQQLKFVAEETGKGGDIVYIGHSMGTTLAFMYLSENPDDGLVKKLIALAPVAYLDNVQVLRSLALVLIPVFESLGAAGIKGLFRYEEILHVSIANLCRLFPYECFLVMELFWGQTVQFDPKDLMLFYSFWPTGTSIYQFVHYLQIAQSGRFQKYDYGALKNLKKYGTAEPPTYNLSNVRCDTHLFYGERDFIYSEQDLERLFTQIGSQQKFKRAFASKTGYEFSHGDFLFSKYLKEFLHPPLYAALKE